MKFILVPRYIITLICFEFSSLRHRTKSFDECQSGRIIFGARVGCGSASRSRASCLNVSRVIDKYHRTYPAAYHLHCTKCDDNETEEFSN